MGKANVFFPIIISISLILALSVFLNAQETADVDMQSNHGVSLLEKGKLDEAIEQFEKIIEANPNYGKAYANLGWAYYQKRNFDKAIVALKKATELDPNNTGIHQNLGNTYTDIGKFDEATVELNKVIELDPNNANAYVDLGVVFSKQENTEKGMSHFKKAIAINPNNPMARKNLGYSYYTLKKWPEAIDELLYARDIDEWHPGVEETLTLTLDKAFSDLKMWAEEKPRDSLSHYYFAYALAYKGEWKKAEKEIDIAIKLGGKQSNFFKAKAFFSSSQNKREDAIKACNECIRADASNWACYDRLGRNIGDTKKGLESLLKANQINSNIIQVQSDLGVAYSSLEENERAIEAFKKALSLGAVFPGTHLNLAISYFKLKKYELAWRHTRIAERLGFQPAKEFVKKLQNVSKEPE